MILSPKNIAYTILAGFLSVTVMSTAAPAANDLPSWQKEVMLKISKKQVYPRSAIDNEIEGKAKVKITIDRSGKIAAFNLVQPTGKDVLDKEVPKLMERIDPLPTPPASMSDDQLTFVLPLTWSLN